MSDENRRYIDMRELDRRHIEGAKLSIWVTFFDGGLNARTACVDYIKDVIDKDPPQRGMNPMEQGWWGCFVKKPSFKVAPNTLKGE